MLIASFFGVLLLNAAHLRSVKQLDAFEGPNLTVKVASKSASERKPAIS